MFSRFSCDFVGFGANIFCFAYNTRGDGLIGRDCAYFHNAREAIQARNRTAAAYCALYLGEHDLYYYIMRLASGELPRYLRCEEEGLFAHYLKAVRPFQVFVIAWMMHETVIRKSKTRYCVEDLNLIPESDKVYKGGINEMIATVIVAHARNVRPVT